jgi:NADPH-dependent 2,4-dienoyl-CoA reductase/sulfur reductase-like enzyme
MDTADGRESEMSERVVIVGGGQAGGRVASALRKQGFEGSVTIVCDEQAVPYERPPMSKDYLAGDKPFESTCLEPTDWYAANRVDLVLGHSAVSIDRPERSVKLDDGSSLPYDHLVIATGARARRLSVPGGDHPRVMVLRTKADADALRPLLKEGTRVILLGAGVIGLEVAATARKLGASVLVLELADRPMARLMPHAISDRFVALHRDNGIELKFSTHVAAISGTPDKPVVETADGGRYEADVVLAGIGVVPNVELASQAGLPVENGILVDSQCRTQDPAILAIGDVAMRQHPHVGKPMRLETWQTAENTGAIAAATIRGETCVVDEVPWFWTDQFGINVQIAGLPDQVQDIVWRTGPGGPDSVGIFLGEDGRVVGGITWNSGRDMRFIRKMAAARAQIPRETLADPAVGMNKITF